ncbi:MAG: DUF5007 domain-containing protein [Bacteroidota bacterium]|nr:DUF5007 domain-containing protein [Bacteroidota bacterium]
MKKKYRKINIAILLSTMAIAGILSGCTKIEKGFLSPYVQYAVNQFSIIRGRTATSYSLINDGSSIPMHIKWTHIYDSTGKIVDDIFLKEYPVSIWTAAYDPLTDKTFATITAKRTVKNMPPIVVNETNGTIQANSGTINLPLGTYSMDLQLSNIAGSEPLKKIMQITIVDGKPLETSPEQGAFSLSLLKAGTASGVGALGGSNNGVLFNGANNPFVDFTVTRFADTPNILIVKVADRNGVPFDPKTGEFAKRPNSGLNPNPPFLQNLQDYAPDTFTTTDTAMFLKYPLAPFPIASLGNGYNMYYRIPSQYVHIDSTSNWSSNTAGNFYKGIEDVHYKGVYTDGKFDYAVRIPMRIQVPGSYEISIKLLNATHR